MENQTLWVRSKDGWVAGVCSGLAKHFAIDVWLMRAIWIASIFLFLPIIFYFILAFCLPREDKIELANQPKFLGVCLKLGKKFQIEVGLVRTIVLSSLLVSCGFTFLLYFIAHMILVSQENQNK